MWLEAFELSEEMFEAIRRKVEKVGGYVTMIKNSDFLPYADPGSRMLTEKTNKYYFFGILVIIISCFMLFQTILQSIREKIKQISRRK